MLNEPHIRFYAGCPLRYEDGSKLGTLCIIDRKPRNLDAEDMEVLKDLALTTEHELAAVQLATQDELTNTINRRGFMMLAKHSINLCVRQKLTASLAFLDLNKFKQINDELGHAEGDKVLIVFSNLVKDVCRESDIFARLGGDEFVILFVDASKRAAEDILIRLRQSLDEYNLKSDHGYVISFSYGVVEFNPDKHMSIEALLNDGDSLMYEWKNKRNNEGG